MEAHATVTRRRGKGPGAGGGAVYARAGVLELLPPEPPGGAAAASQSPRPPLAAARRPRPRSAGCIGPRRKDAAEDAAGGARPATARAPLAQRPGTFTSARAGAGAGVLASRAATPSRGHAYTHAHAQPLSAMSMASVARPVSAASVASTEVGAAGFFSLTGVAGAHEAPLPSRGEQRHAGRAGTPDGALNTGRAGPGSLRASRAAALVEQEEAAARRRAELESYMTSLRQNDAISLPKELETPRSESEEAAPDSEAGNITEEASEASPSPTRAAMEPEVKAAIEYFGGKDAARTAQQAADAAAAAERGTSPPTGEQPEASAEGGHEARPFEQPAAPTNEAPAEAAEEAAEQGEAAAGGEAVSAQVEEMSASGEDERLAAASETPALQQQDAVADGGVPRDEWDDSASDASDDSDDSVAEMLARAAALGAAPKGYVPPAPKQRYTDPAEAEETDAAAGETKTVTDEEAAAGEPADDIDAHPVDVAEVEAAAEAADDALAAHASRQESRRDELRGYMSRLASEQSAVDLGPTFDSGVDAAIAALEARVREHEGGAEAGPSGSTGAQVTRASAFLEGLSFVATDSAQRASVAARGGDREDESADAVLRPRMSKVEREGMAGVNKLDERLAAAEAAAQARMWKQMPTEMAKRQASSQAEAESRAAEALRLARKRRRRARKLARVLAGVGRAGSGGDSGGSNEADSCDPEDVMRRNALLVSGTFVGSLNDEDEALVERLLADANYDGDASVDDDDSATCVASCVSSVWVSGFAADDSEAQRLAAIEAKLERYETAHMHAEGPLAEHSELSRPGTAAPTVWSVRTTVAGDDFLERARAAREDSDAVEHVDKQLRALVTSHMERASTDQIAQLVQEARAEQEALPEEETLPEQ